VADVAGAAVVDQVNLPEAMVVPSKLHQGRDVMISVVGLEVDRFHLAGMDDQKSQDVHCAVPDIVKFLLFDRARDTALNWDSLEDLAVGHLIGAYHADPAPG
jgi:hypothetical protein